MASQVSLRFGADAFNFLEIQAFSRPFGTRTLVFVDSPMLKHWAILTSPSGTPDFHSLINCVCPLSDSAPKKFPFRTNLSSARALLYPTFISCHHTRHGILRDWSTHVCAISWRGP